MSDFTVIDSKKLAKLKKLNLKKIQLDEIEKSFGMDKEQTYRFYKVTKKITKLIQTL